MLAQTKWKERMRYLIVLGVVVGCALPFALRGPAATVFSRGPSCEDLAGAPELELVLGAPEVEVDDTRPRETIAALDMKARNLSGYARSGWVTAHSGGDARGQAAACAQRSLGGGSLR